VTPDETLTYRVERLEEGLEANAKRVGRAMEVAARHEEQINGDRGLSKSMATLSEDVRTLTKTLRDIDDARSRRLWQAAIALLIAVIGAFATIYAAGVPG
jgi:phosphoserine phosphatase